MKLLRPFGDNSVVLYLVTLWSSLLPNRSIRHWFSMLSHQRVFCWKEKVAALWLERWTQCYNGPWWCYQHEADSMRDWAVALEGVSAALFPEIKGKETADSRLAGVCLVFPPPEADGVLFYWLLIHNWSPWPQGEQQRECTLSRHLKKR